MLHHGHFAGGDVLEVEHIFAPGPLEPAAVVDLPDILQGDLGAKIVVGPRARRTDVAQHMLMHQRAAQRLNQCRINQWLVALDIDDHLGVKFTHSLGDAVGAGRMPGRSHYNICAEFLRGRPDALVIRGHEQPIEGLRLPGAFDYPLQKRLAQNGK